MRARARGVRACPSCPSSPSRPPCTTSRARSAAASAPMSLKSELGVDEGAARRRERRLGADEGAGRASTTSTSCSRSASPACRSAITGRADAALEHLRQRGDDDARTATRKEIAQIMAAELDGLMRLGARTIAPGALAALARAAALEAKRPKPIARPYPIKPAAELYAEILLRHRRRGRRGRAVQGRRWRARRGGRRRCSAWRGRQARRGSRADAARRRRSFSPPGTSPTQDRPSSRKRARSLAESYEVTKLRSHDRSKFAKISNAERRLRELRDFELVQTSSISISRT